MSQKGEDMTQYLLHWHNKQEVNLPTNELEIGLWKISKETQFNLSSYDNLEASKKLISNLIDLGNVFGISLNLIVF